MFTMTFKIDRVELYNRIWEHGITKTAEKLNTTAEKLKASAQNANIPLPSPSYWGNLHIGKTVTKTKLPDPEKNSSIIIPEKKKSISKIEKEIIQEVTRKSTSTQENIVIQAYLPNVKLDNPKLVNEAFVHIKVPNTMPTKKEKFIENSIIEKNNENKSFLERSYIPIGEKNLNFHRRYNIKLTSNCLIVTNTLLKSLNESGANISLNTKGDINLELERAKLTLKCYVPSKRILLSPDDKNWRESNEYEHVAADEAICYSIQLKDSWSTPAQIHHRVNESDTDYVKRVFIKIIALIPKSREKIEREKQRAIERIEEEKQKEIRYEKHEKVYNELKKLLNDVKAHQVSTQLNSYLQEINIQDPEKLERFSNLSKWIDGDIDSDILTESDRQHLISDFFNSKENYYRF